MATALFKVPPDSLPSTDINPQQPTNKKLVQKNLQTEHLNTLYIGMSGNNFKLSSNALMYAC